MKARGVLPGIVVVLVGCTAPAPSDAVSTSVGQDSAIQNYDEEYTVTWPVPGTLYIDYALIDSTNLVAEYVVEVRRGHPLTLTYLIEPNDARPLRLLVNVGASNTPLLSLAASETEVVVSGPGQSPELDETGYSAPVLDGGLPSLDAGEGPEGGVAEAPVDAGVSLEDLDDAVTAARYDLPSQKFEPIPAMFQNRRQSSYGGNVTGYDPDGAQILPWTGAGGTLQDAFTYMTYCLAPDGRGGVAWECPAGSSN
jgi:hypothetical protein